MDVVSPDRIRNVALVGHGGAGKTTLAEALLFEAKAVTRRGRVEDGNTVCDFDPEEHKRGISVSLALAPDIGELHRLLGDIERELEHPDEAKAHYRRYLELVPGKLRDQERVRGLLEELGGAPAEEEAPAEADPADE